MRSAHTIVSLVVLSNLLATPGCQSTQRVQVEVRDVKTKEPAVGIRVLADIPSRNHPFSVASILGQTGERSSFADTNAQGIASFDLIPDRPVRIGVLGRGWAVGLVLLEPADWTGNTWRTVGSGTTQNDATNDRVAEIRVFPGLQR